jgi:transcriptional regulator with XRE-family HTH domain
MESREYNIAFGRFIRDGRELRGLHQSDVADRVGISQPHYARIESGSRAVSLSLAMQLCDQLNLDINDFSKQYVKTP